MIPSLRERWIVLDTYIISTMKHLALTIDFHCAKRYPISQIPVMGNVNDLAACFLTYHTLSTCFEGSDHAYNSSPGREQNVPPQGMKFKLKGSREEQIALPPFAVSTYLQDDVWRVVAKS